MSYYLAWCCHKHNRTFRFGRKCPIGRDKCAKKWALYNEVDADAVQPQ